MRLISQLLKCNFYRNRHREVMYLSRGLSHCLTYDGAGFDPDKIWIERVKDEPRRNEVLYNKWRDRQRRFNDEEIN